MAKCRIYETLGSVSDLHVDKSSGLMTLSGVFGVCGVRNRNNRIYETKNYSAMISEMQKRIQEQGGIPGELEHPNSMNTSLENISHKIISVDIDENGTVTGTIQLLNTPKGQIAQAIVEGGLPLFISSRAQGQIDRAGHVTLETLKTYDLVSDSGFEQARLHLNESLEEMSTPQSNIAIISEKDDTQMDEPEIETRIAALEERLEELENENEDLRNKIEEGAGISDSTLRKLADGIQKWIIEDYSPVVQKWIVEEFSDEMNNKTKRMFADEIAPKIQEWVIEHYSPEVEKWVVEQFAPEVERWIVEQYSPGVQNWVINHFAPEIENWLNESYSSSVKGMIDESLKDTKQNKLHSIVETLNMLESIPAPDKPDYKGRTIVNENIDNEPLYIQKMPESIRPKYNMASQQVKESISRRARLYDFTKSGAIERFWENINFDEIKPIETVYEGLDGIENQREREIRAAFRRHRSY